MNKNTDEI